MAEVLRAHDLVHMVWDETSVFRPNQQRAKTLCGRVVNLDKVTIFSFEFVTCPDCHYQQAIRKQRHSDCILDENELNELIKGVR